MLGRDLRGHDVRQPAVVCALDSPGAVPAAHAPVVPSETTCAVEHGPMRRSHTSSTAVYSADSTLGVQPRVRSESSQVRCPGKSSVRVGSTFFGDDSRQGEAPTAASLQFRVGCRAREGVAYPHSVAPGHAAPVEVSQSTGDEPQPELSKASTSRRGTGRYLKTGLLVAAALTLIAIAARFPSLLSTAA